MIPEKQVGSFPFYEDGDVQVILSPSRRYQLHSSVLRHNSSTLAGLLTEAKSLIPANKLKKGEVKVRWRLELQRGFDSDDISELVPARVDQAGRLLSSQSLLENENGLPPSMIYSHYNNILGAYYGQDVEIDDTDIASVLSNAHGLIHVAEYLDSMNSVSKSINVALLGQGQVLYRSISTSPVPWMNLAYDIRSEIILRESLIHLIGNWNALSGQVKSNIRSEMQEICKSKLQEMQTMKTAVNVRLFGHYPESVQRKAEDGFIGRSSYSNDIMTWVAIGVLRHWLGQAVAQRLTWDAPDGGFDFYTKISKGRRAYLDRVALRQFHERFPMTAKGQSVLETHLNELKESLRPFTADIVANKSLLDVTQYPLSYLTCLPVHKRDVPWLKDKLASGLSPLEESGDENDESAGSADASEAD